MLPVIFKFVLSTLAVFLCALAVKLVDDFLDCEFDVISGRENWARHLGTGTLVYAMLFLAFAAGLDAAISVPLFLSSYMLGMFNDFRQIFPSKLTGWQETFLVLFIGIVIFSWDAMLFSLLMIIAVQLIDDSLDYSVDILTGQRNLAHRLGMVESLLLAVIALLSAYWLNPVQFVPVLCGIALFYLSLFYKEALKW